MLHIAGAHHLSTVKANIQGSSSPFAGVMQRCCRTSWPGRPTSHGYMIGDNSKRKGGSISRYALCAGVASLKR